MNDWTPDLSASDRPRYIALADRIASDIQDGRLRPGDRLPAQRKLAEQLGLDFTTVARGYVEAQRRGLVVSRGSQGTFVLDTALRPAASVAAPASPARVADLMMNLPPEPDDPALIGRMQAALDYVGRDLIELLRYQGFGGSPGDKEVAASWLARRGLAPDIERVYVTPGAHPTVLGILRILTKAGDVVLSDRLTFPGVRSIAAQLGLSLTGVAGDAEGMDAEALDAACRALKPRILYLNPVLQNPTTVTISRRRRIALAEVARRHRLTIIEDDAYGFIPLDTPPPLASIAPDITWYIAALAKCLGAGLRTAYVVAPDVQSGWALAQVLRCLTAMASPITVALASRWIQDGTADGILRFVRSETEARQAIVRQTLPLADLTYDPAGFHLWLTLPDGWTRSTFTGHMRATGLGVVPSDAFAATNPPPEAVRISLGGPITRTELERALKFAAHALKEQPAIAAPFL
jgi:DNA-binding transcriptional MocR family regulator